MSNVPSSQRFLDMVGDENDPTKRPRVGQEAFKKVLEERRVKRQEEAVKLVHEKLDKCAGIHEKVVKLRKEFEGAEVKAQKELGKAINELNNLLEREGVDSLPDATPETTTE